MMTSVLTLKHSMDSMCLIVVVCNSGLWKKVELLKKVKKKKHRISFRQGWVEFNPFFLLEWGIFLSVLACVCTFACFSHAFFSVSKLSAWPREEVEHHYPSSIFKATGERCVCRTRESTYFLMAEEEEMTASGMSRSGGRKCFKYYNLPWRITFLWSHILRCFTWMCNALGITWLAARGGLAKE